MTAVLWLLAGLVIGLVLGPGRAFARGVARGRRLTELEHGYLPATEVRRRRPRDWPRLNRQPREPEPVVQPPRPGLDY